MIGYLKGRVFENHEGNLIVTAGDEEAAVGYSVLVPQSMAYLRLVPGAQAELFIYTHVREDALDLFGFLSRAEKELFLTLLQVKGIGPKAAANLLSKVEPGQLIRTIIDGDREGLAQIPRVGKKTADRVVAELGDTLAKKLEAGAFPGLMMPPFPAGAQAAGAAMPVSRGDATSLSVLKDAREALLSLGYREPAVTPVLRKLLENGPEVPDVEEVIRSALQKLSF